MAAGAGLIRRPAVAALAALLLAAAPATRLLAQDPVPPDSVVGPLPDSVREVFGDTIERDPQRFPARLVPLRGPSHEVFVCDRACVQASTAFSLLELLIEEVPGIAGLRGGFFAGPHHALDGPFGPGFVELYIDGREILSLERGQTDLRRLSLNYVESVRAYRGANGIVIDVALVRHDATRAYSRIAGGTGDPRTQLLDGVFANGLGRSINVEAAFDLLDVGAGGTENDRFEAFGRVSWMPSSDRFGLQLEFRTGSVDRAAVDTVDVRRSEVLLRMRGNLGSRAQIEAFAASSNYRLEVPGLAEGETAPSRGADAVGLRLSWMPGDAGLWAGVRLAGGDAYPSVRTDVAGWVPFGPLTLEGGARLASWNEFSTRSLRVGLAYRDTLLVPLALRAFAARGDRGIGFPEAGAADSVGFAGAGASAGLDVGPFDLSGRVARQRLDREVPFGPAFLRDVVLDGTEVEVTSWEARLEGPLIPLGGLLPGVEPVRLTGFVRSNDAGGAQALFVPDYVARAELSLHDTFFEGNLELWLSGFLERRGQRAVPAVGSAEPVLLAADTWPGGHFMFKIGDFRFFWRFTNPTGLVVNDLPGVEFPPRVNVFGLRWEFFN